MLASQPFYAQRPHDSLSVLKVCQELPFGDEFKQVDKDLVSKLDPFIHQCLKYSSPHYKSIKGYKSYDTDKGRFVGLSAYARVQTSAGYIALSRQELITILFLMAIYRADKEVRSSETVADPVETCSLSDPSEYDSPLHTYSTSTYILNRHYLLNDASLLEEIREKISLIKDNLNKYFTMDYDAGRDLNLYYNNLLTGQIDYTDEGVFVSLIPKITTKTKPASAAKCPQGKSRARSAFPKRRTTISQTPMSLTISTPLLASAENHQIQEISDEPVMGNNGNTAEYVQYPTPSYEYDYQMAQYPAPDFMQDPNFVQIQQTDQAMLFNLANQGEHGASVIYEAYVHSQQDRLYNCIQRLIQMYENLTGRKYSDAQHDQQLYAQAVQVLNVMPPNYMVPHQQAQAFAAQCLEAPTHSG